MNLQITYTKQFRHGGKTDYPITETLTGVESYILEKGEQGKRLTYRANGKSHTFHYDISALVEV